MYVSTNPLCKIWKAVSQIGTDVEAIFSSVAELPEVSLFSLSFVNVRKHGWCIYFAGSDCRWYGVILELAEKVTAS